MSAIIISPYRLIPDSFPDNLSVLEQQFKFGSTGPDPCAKNIAGSQYSLGTDSDWSADNDNLIIECLIQSPRELLSLFGNKGIAALDATLLLALEWTSADSGTRQIGKPFEISLEQSSGDDPIVLSLHLGARSVRGIGEVAIQVFLGNPGNFEGRDAALAIQRGFRFGMIGTTIVIVIDGDSSLFPILEQSCGTEAALWQFRENWTDPREDEFSSDYVALVLNTDHANFEQLCDRRGASTKHSALMTQILASWIAVLVAEVIKRMEIDFNDLVGGNHQIAETYSIAETAAGFVRSGELDTSSLPALFESTQRWLNQRVKETEGAE